MTDRSGVSRSSPAAQAGWPLGPFALSAFDLPVHPELVEGRRETQDRLVEGHGRSWFDRLTMNGF